MLDREFGIREKKTRIADRGLKIWGTEIRGQRPENETEYGSNGVTEKRREKKLWIADCEEQDAQLMMKVQVQVGADLCVCPDHESVGWACGSSKIGQ